jgi:hypothetical protein
MTPTAAVGNENSSHDVVLTDGATAVGLVLCDANGVHDPLALDEIDLPASALKIYSGVQKNADGEPPWTPIEQLDWSGGRGGFDLDKDGSKYYESEGVSTVRAGEIVLAGAPCYATGHRAAVTKWQWQDSFGNSPVRYPLAVDNHVGFRYGPPANVTMKTVTFVVRLSHTTGYSAGTLTVRLRADALGTVPGTIADTATLSLGTLIPGIYQQVQVTFETGMAQVSGTGYWVEFTTTAPGVELLAYLTSSSDSGTYLSTDGSAWAKDSTPLPYYKQIYIQVAPASPNIEMRYFEYKGALYRVNNPADGSAPSLWINGDCGVATGTQTSTTLQDTTKTWTANQWKGRFVRLMRGGGEHQPTPFRLITANTADTLTVSPAWDTTPTDAASEYVIIGDDNWTEVTGHGWAAGQIVYSILPANGAVYFARGDAAGITRLVRYNNAGTWTTTWATDGAGTGTHLLLGSDQRGPAIWIAYGGYPAKLWRAALDPTNHDWTDGAGSDLTWTLESPVGDMQGRINGLELYGEFGSPWVLKEEGFYEMYGGQPYRKSAAEMANVADYRNGKGHCVHGVYLYVSQHDGVVRYFNGMIDGVGPEKAEKPPQPLERGYFPSLVGYPGVVIGAHRAANGYSTVKVYNGMGWCTWFKAPAGGLTINQVYVQSMPGDIPDRLWFNCGPDSMWMHLGVDPFSHRITAYYQFNFNWQGWLQSAWLYAGRNQLNKYWHALAVAYDSREDIGATGLGNVDLYYRVDGGLWTYLGTNVDEVEISADHDEAGRRIQIMLGFQSAPGNGDNTTPRVTAVVVKAIVREEINQAYAIQFRLFDRDIDLNEQPDPYQSYLDKFNALDAMRQSALPVTVTSRASPLDNLVAFVDSVQRRPGRIETPENLEAYIGALRLVKVTRTT